jgi:hypothetical protein
MSVSIRLVAALVAAFTLGAPAVRPTRAVLSGARRVDIRSSSGVSVRTGDPAAVAKISRWLERLPRAPAHRAYFCPLIRADSPTVRFAFRGAGDGLLARAGVLDAFRGVSGVCNPISLSASGHRRELLLGGRFLLRVQRLLGVRFG